MAEVLLIPGEGETSAVTSSRSVDRPNSPFMAFDTRSLTTSSVLKWQR